MRNSIRLGRIAGIDVGLNISVLVIAAVVVVGLAFGRFPAAYQDLSGWAYVTAGVVAAVLLLASLLVHELAHAVVARRNGIEITGITLWLLGGVAQLRGEPRSPGADLRVAVVGPVASFVAAGIFALITWLISAVAGAGLAAGVFAYLAGINVILGVFNLIPAAPLDGGRVLRAFLWWRRGDRLGAAISAARAGRVFGFALIALGIAGFLVGGGFNGLWLALIGLFLVNAAAAEEQQTRVNATLHGVRVGDVMTARPVTAEADHTVAALIEQMVFAHRFSTYPLLDDGRLAGLVTLNRIRAVPAGRRGDVRLADIACRPEEVPTARPDEPLTELLPRMAGCADGRAVVLDADGRVAGLITPSDISRAMQVAELRGSDPSSSSSGGADLASWHGDHTRSRAA